MLEVKQKGGQHDVDVFVDLNQTKKCGMLSANAAVSAVSVEQEISLSVALLLQK